MLVWRSYARLTLVHSDGASQGNQVLKRPALIVYLLLFRRY